MESSRVDVLIVGGGIIGLGLAYELARRGQRVTVLEQGEWGGQASSAAAGMLAPLKEFSRPGPLLDLGMASLAAYPEWAAGLKEETGIDVQLVQRGVLTVAMDEREAELLKERHQWQRAAGYDVQWLEGQSVREREPVLSEKAAAALYSPAEGHVNNRLLLTALVTACRKRGVRLVPGTVVTGLNTENNRVRGVETSAGTVWADATVIASGAWSGLMARWLGLSVPIRPVRGQVAAVSSQGILLSHVVFGFGGYLVPKRDGRIVLGATEDESGYCRDVTLGGLASVLSGALPYVPALHDAPFLEAWAGLRPATADGLPVLGPVPGWDGVAISSGHFRNGILLAPVTARLMADWLTGGTLAPLAPFLPERFA